MVDKKEGEGAYDFAPEEGAPQVPAAPAETIPAQALPERVCPHCGYRIVGKALRGRCPECSALLDEVTTDRLQFSDPRWLAMVSNGTLLLALAIVGQTGGIVLGWLEKWSQGALVHAVAAATGALGVWLATKREPGIGTVKSLYAHAARWAAVGAAVLWILPLVRREAGPVEGKDVMALVVLAAMGLEATLVALHLRTLAVRVPNDSLAAHLLNLAFLVPALCVVLAALQWIGQANIHDMNQKFLCGFSIIGGMAVMLLWTVITLLRTGIEMRNCVAAGQMIQTRKELKAAQMEKEKQQREQRRRGP